MRSIFLFFFFSSLFANSQNHKITGKVVEYNTKTPIPFAHVFIKDVMYGTVTNEIGEFELVIEQNLTDQKLTISCIGYNEKLIPIDFESEILITLNKSSLLLNDIVISAKEDSARMLLQKAAKAIKKNYPKHKYLQKGFYRELGINDGTYTRLIEAAITLQDNGYDPHDANKDDFSANNSRIKIDEVRKSNDYRTYTLLGKSMFKNNILLLSYSIQNHLAILP